MPVVAFTDLFNECLDDLAAKLATISGLQVVTDPRNLVPPCVFIDAPTFQAYNGNIVKMSFPVRCITLGPGNLDAQKSLLNMLAQVYALNIGIISGRPTNVDIGGSVLPAYELTVATEVQTA